MVRAFHLAWPDLPHAVRGLVRNPIFALSAIAAIALGIGPAAAVFSVVDRILFRALPYAREDRLVSVGMMAPLDTSEFMFAVEYFDLRRDPGPFEEVTSFQSGALECDLNEQNPVRLKCLRVEANFLRTLGIPLAAGRSFSSDEDRPHGARAAMISYGLWRSRLGADPRALGRTLMLDGMATTIVAVLPKSFEMPTLTRADVLLPEALDEAREGQGRAFRVFARLRAGVSVAQARARLAPHFARALETVPPQFRSEIRLRVRPVRDRQVGDARLAALTLFGSVLAVLLIACANVANLLLARGVARERELAVRAALGASRWRLVRPALAESVAIALCGGAAGTGMAHGLLRVLIAMAPSGLPRLDEAAIDMRVLLFATGLSVSSGVLFGLVPALRSTGGAMLAGWRVTGPSKGGLRSVLVATQIAASMVLLTGAGLLLRSLWNLESIPTGIETEHLLTARFVLGSQRYRRDVDQLAFFNELEQRLAALPGAETVAISDSIPPSGGTRGRPLAAIAIEGVLRRPEGTGGMVAWRYVTPRYFAALGTPILRGRSFDARDRNPTTYAVIVSESLARRLFPGQEAIGRRILRDPTNDWYTVIGIAADVKNRGPQAPAEPEYYLLRKAVPDATFRNQEPPTGWRAATVIVRTVDPALAANSVRHLLASLDPTIPVETETMRQRFAEITARPRFDAMLLTLFAAVALVLAAVGLFGVMAFLVAQRTREFGVRVALGATPGAVMRSALADALRWTLAGLIIGAAGSLSATRLLRSLLFQVPFSDMRAPMAALILLSAVALAASAGPALRAVRVDPIKALREE